ncbi:MAG: RNA 2',3'-cyclic phosphodiesterase [Caldilineaceae bacterium SB0665_bin_21]|nr:RNA 2',3'-cyclic phosphodiesterase [Caldilineaceae bacterium SB0665_bin_21]
MKADTKATRANCFLGCSLPDDAVSWLCAWQRHLQQKLSTTGLERAVGWVRPESLHLTLVFLGPLQDRECRRLQDLLDGQFDSLSVLDIMIQPPRIFPKPNRSRGLWCPVIESENRLQQLHGVLLSAVDEADLTLDSKPFRPHITLGRIRRRFQGHRELKGLQLVPNETLLLLPEQKARLRQIHLYRTDATPQGNLYHRLATWTL